MAAASSMQAGSLPKTWHAGGVLARPQLQQGEGLFILIAQGLGADHLRDGQPRAQLPADGAEGQVRHPRHGGQHQLGINIDGTDLQSDHLISEKSSNILFYHKKSLLAKPLKYDMMDKTHNAHDIFVVAADLCGHGSHPKRREPPC